MGIFKQDPKLKLITFTFQHEGAEYDVVFDPSDNGWMVRQGDYYMKATSLSRLYFERKKSEVSATRALKILKQVLDPKPLPRSGSNFHPARNRAGG